MRLIERVQNVSIDRWGRITTALLARPCSTPFTYTKLFIPYMTFLDIVIIIIPLQMRKLRIWLSCYTVCIVSKTLHSISSTPHKTRCGDTCMRPQHLGFQGYPLLHETISKQNKTILWCFDRTYNFPSKRYIFFYISQAVCLFNF